MLEIHEHVTAALVLVQSLSPPHCLAHGLSHGLYTLFRLGSSPVYAIVFFPRMDAKHLSSMGLEWDDPGGDLENKTKPLNFYFKKCSVFSLLKS